MNHDPTRCARPECRFSPLPEINADGVLEVSLFCSKACRGYCIAAYYTSNADPTDEVQRQLRQLVLVNALLDLRESPSEWDASFPTVEGMKAVLRA
ncbi:hypothetical protein [Streptomyces sp. NPDC126514]|uniref:hypothetical protein n=1 Tax=Streptomyces sp. NPDC126514 TaxID=3155210 RepID=UPI003328A432